MEAILNHLWQSTAFAIAVAALCIALRSNRARIRYWLWLTASLKFLIPFSLLMSIGNRVEIPASSPPATAVTVEAISTTFSPAPILITPKPSRWPAALGVIWSAGALFVISRWLRKWRRLRGVARSAKPLALNLPIPALVHVFESSITYPNRPLPLVTARNRAETSIEPGIFGVFRPVLLLPDGLTATLTQEQLQAIVAHELCHVRERDNLTAAMHMFVEALFWFHPLVWWIGAKLIEERERACDETVVAQGGLAEDYATGILTVCKFYVESPLVCAAGVTGSDLKRRIREIMANRLAPPLTFTRKALLAAAACAACSLPLVIGILRAQTLPPPPEYGYEVVSIRPSEPGQVNSQIGPGPQGGIRTRNTLLLAVLAFAYNKREFQFGNIPDWVKSARYDITLTPDKPEITPSPGMPQDQMESLMGRHRQRMQAVLRDRFGLVLRAESKEQTMYALVVARDGHKLRQPADTSRGPHLSANQSQITGTSAYLSMLVNSLSSILGRHVSNETGLDGPFDFAMQWTPDSPARPDEPATTADTANVSIFTALTEQLGLKLESKRAPVPTFVIEKIEKPTEN